MKSHLKSLKKIFKLYTSRLISELRFLLPIIFLIILIFPIIIGQSNFEKSKIIVLDNPIAQSAHLFLAQKLLANNQLNEAATEFSLAQNVEGLAEINKLKSEPEDIKNQIVFWEKIADQFPNYRDAYIKLAILNYKLDRPLDAKKFLDKALEIDPNNEAAKKVQELLK